MDNAIGVRITYPLDSDYRVDSTIQLLNNRGQEVKLGTRVPRVFVPLDQQLGLSSTGQGPEV